MEADIFETHYENYCRQIAALDFSSIKDALGMESDGDTAVIPFLGETYRVTGAGIADESGNRPDYGVCVILSKYLLRCPDVPVAGDEWASLKDFHKQSQFTNVNVFASDAELPIIRFFSGRIDALSDAARKLGGKPCEFGASYDMSMEFNALPKIKILLLFNDGDGEFPASCALLFQRRAEDYLDPESLIMVGIAFANRLTKMAS